MGDCYRSIVDREASEDEAPALGASIRDWLVSEGIIDPSMRDCVLGADAGYPPGPDHAKATELTHTHLLRLRCNGLEISTRREFYYSMTGDELQLVCDDCRRRFVPGDEQADAVGEWLHGTGPGLLPCPSCGSAKPINKWQHEPPWEFGNLGFTFWNWAPLKSTFVAEMSRRLGHEVGEVRGKI